MSDMLFDSRIHHKWSGVGMITLHISITLLALGIAFSLPIAAQFILFQWWPRVASDTSLLLASEFALAALLLLLFNLFRAATVNGFKGRVADIASLVYARHSANWLTRFRERSLIRRLPPARDAFIMTLTGYDTFAGENSLLRGPLRAAYEIRVMLLNPAAHGADTRIGSLPRTITRQSYVDEVNASIAFLAELRQVGRKVTLKFYDDEPFWKLAVLGDHLWVQYCHKGFEVKGDPEYVFALNPGQPRRGLFVPFYMYFLERWSDPRHPHYDFDTGELVYVDGKGREIRRAPLHGDEAGVCAAREAGDDEIVDLDRRP